MGQVREVEVPGELADRLAPQTGLGRADEEVLAAWGRLEGRRSALANVGPAPARRRDTTTDYWDGLVIIDDLIARRREAQDAASW